MRNKVTFTSFPRRRLIFLSVFFAALMNVLGVGSAVAQRASQGSASIEACDASGKADATQCLQSVLNSANLRTIAFPKNGKFLITASLIVSGGKTLIGNGAEIDANVGLFSLLRIKGSSVNVSGLRFKSGEGRVESGIWLMSGASDVTLSGNFINGPVRGMLIGGPGDINISKITISNNIIDGGGAMRFGILLNSRKASETSASITADQYPQHIVINKNRIFDVAGDAIEINSPVAEGRGATVGSGRAKVAAHDINIADNILRAPFSKTRDAGFCIGVAGAYDVVISRNVMSQCKWQGVHIEDSATNVTIANNRIDTTIGPQTTDDKSCYVNGSAGCGALTSDGILVLNSNDISILSNTVMHAHNNGIDLGWNSWGVNHGVAVAGNKITDSGDYGISALGYTKGFSATIGPVHRGHFPKNAVSGSRNVHNADFPGEIAACDAPPEVIAGISSSNSVSSARITNCRKH